MSGKGGANVTQGIVVPTNVIEVIHALEVPLRNFDHSKSDSERIRM